MKAPLSSRGFAARATPSVALRRPILFRSRSTTTNKAIRATPSSDNTEEETRPPPAALSLPDDPRSHARNALAIERYVRRSFDEEWRLELEDHAAIGRAAAASYRRLVLEKSRQQQKGAESDRSSESSGGAGEGATSSIEVGDVLLAVASDLASRPSLFAETFTDAFEAANKVAELLLHGLAGETSCACVDKGNVALMEEAYEFARGEGVEQSGESEGK